MPIDKIPRPGRSFLNFVCDVVGPISVKSSGGHQYILTLMECYSKYPFAFALKSTSSVEIVDCLMSVFCMFGIFDLYTDRGTCFTSSLNDEIYNRLGIIVKHGAVHHSSSYGLIERLNGTIEKLLKVVLQYEVERERKNWHKYLNYLMWSLRSSVHDSTGFSPHEMLFGHKPQDLLSIIKNNWCNIPDEPPKLKKDYSKYLQDLQTKLKTIAELATKTTDKLQERYVSSYNTQRIPKKFDVGDSVLVLLPMSNNKLLSKWEIAEVTGVISENTYSVVLQNGAVKTLHSDHLRKFIAPVQSVGVVFEEDEEMGNISCVPMLSDSDVYDVDNSMCIDKFANVELKHLTKSQQTKMLNLLKKHQNIFSNIPGFCNVVKHEIPLVEGAKPKAFKPYRIPDKFREEIDRQLDELLEQGRITYSNSCFAAPVVVVVKKDGKSLRLCVNYKGLNDITQPQPYSFPRVDDLTRKASQFKYLTKLDAVSSFWQIGVEPRDRHKTAFITHKGLFEWTCLPFGLRGASFTYQKMADRVLNPHKEYADAYIDDVTVGSNTFEEHLRNLDAVLNSFAVAGITFKLDKCEFCKPKITLLGFIVGNKEIQVVQSKVQAIQNIQYPTTKKQIRSYLGVCNYWRQFMPNFSEIASPLTDLTKSKNCNKFILNEIQKCAFDKLKEMLSTAPLLASPDYAKTFIIYTDSSDIGVGSVLGQEDNNKVFKPIAYASKKFNDTESRWSTIDKEAYAILYALSQFEVIIFGYNIVVYTDHSPLKFISDSVKHSPKLIRWALAIQRFNPTILSVKGKDNIISDALSRLL